MAVTRKTYARIPDVLELPRLIEVQIDSFRWFCEEGLRELFDEINPIESFNKNFELYFDEYEFREPTDSEEYCRERDATFSRPLYVKVRLINRELGEIQEQWVFMGDFPWMTDKGTFIINGAERVVVSQLIRSPGVYFTVEEDHTTGRKLCMAKLIPSRGAWLEFETSKRDVLSVKVDRKRKLPVTVLLRAMGFETDEEILELFRQVDTVPEHQYIKSTLERDPTKNQNEALIEIYKKLRPGDPPTLDNARSFFESLFYMPRRYDLGKVGRHKLNRRLGLTIDKSQRTLTKEDLVKVVEHMILVNNGVETGDDIDHLGNRRVKTVGELIQNQMRIGLLRMERVVRERMSIREPDQMTPMSLINTRPVTAAIREFFGGSQLSQFMDQTNPLAELTHKRRLSALGPGGLRRERAGFDVRDVHHSHYGRICPIETPEGPNIGLIGSLATYARVNEYGFIETPYRKVRNTLPKTSPDLIGRRVREDIIDPETNEPIATRGQVIDEQLAARLAALPLPNDEVPVWPFATDEIEYLAADMEDRYTIAQASAKLNEKREFVDERVSVRRSQQFFRDSVMRVEYMDVSPKQIVSVSAALIPFLEHDDANRALMGSNMQRQAVPLIRPEAPLVGTGMEYHAAVDSGQVIVSDVDGEVVSVTGDTVEVMSDAGERRVYKLRKYERSNQSTCIDQRPVVVKGQRVRRGTVLADSSSTEQGEMALGQNVLVAFMSWEGGNYEDAILISEELVREDKFTSIHIERHEVEARETKLGPEEITRDVPNVGEDALRNLDEDGIIRVGAVVKPGDILVGKVTPRGEKEKSPEEKLLHAIFGEKSRDVKDSCLRLPHGEFGKVIDVKIFTRDNHRDLPAGVDEMVRVSVAQRRKITEGDKMAGRHGNKGVISKVVPIEDMPFLEDGTPVQIILNPLGVPGRMNLGQILETHLGWAADRLGFRAMSPVFDGADEEDISAELARAWLMDWRWREITEEAWQWVKASGIDENSLQDDEEVRRLYLVHHLGRRGYDQERLVRDRRYARRAVLDEWLLEQGYDPELVMGPEDRVASPESNRLAVRICLTEWLKMRGEEVNPAMSDEELQAFARAVSERTNLPLPTSGKMVLYDGKTGEPYDQPVTVGIITMMKLAHLVQDKVHARSIGPYSLVTQQPLGGKAQFGGQRFGEMEVWALEAYGAAYALQEMLTIKSDDVSGRLRTYEAIVKGEEIRPPGVPESFRVLVKELQSLALSVEVLNEKEEVIEIGQEGQGEKLPKLGFGLSLPKGMDMGL
jgi:DNA-directed RNA polymerase subunit beta